MNTGCIKKSTKQITICPNKFCTARGKEDDYYFIEEIRMAANQDQYRGQEVNPYRVFDPNQLCLLCHKPYEHRQNCVLLNCFHAFHKNCLSKFKAISTPTRCPDCNRILSAKDSSTINILEVKNVQILEESKDSPAYKHLDTNICHKCKNNIINEEEFVLRTCRHKYHQRCIRDMLKFNRNLENNPICPECGSQIDLHDLQLLELMIQRQIPISLGEEYKEDQRKSICEVCKNEAYLGDLSSLGCGHRFHSECIATLIGEQTGQKYLLTPREKLDYKLVCPVQHCGFDISYISVKHYLDPEIYKYYEGLYQERMKKDKELNRKANIISSTYVIY